MMPKDKNILSIAIVTFITIILWVVVDTLITYQRPTDIGVNQEMLSPIDPEINFEGVFR
ncbi:MAG: hypothetical protein ABIJ36_02435 [Patescibacteria group bacterium]|nr:hypothetical protein [Patescibacteria group bacterium]